MHPYIVVIEDDHLQEGPLVDELKEAFPVHQIVSISTESAFRSRLPEFRSSAPDIILLDVMLRWTDASRDAAPPPEDVVTGGYYRAGMRCASLLAEDDQLRKIPVIILTILERSDLDRDGGMTGPNRIYLRKSSDPAPLVRKMRESMRATIAS